MKAIAVCAGLVLALSAHAESAARAKLVGQRVVSAPSGAPILICRYLGPEARYEVVASSDRCAPFLRLSDDTSSAGLGPGARTRGARSRW